MERKSVDIKKSTKRRLDSFLETLSIFWPKLQEENQKIIKGIRQEYIRESPWSFVIGWMTH